MFARVIPLLRTPFGVDVFDYRIPEDLKLQPGDLVRMPFRKQEIVGIVESVSADSKHAAKAVTILGSYGDIHFPAAILDLLAETAARTFTSKPAVLKAWLRALPKKPSVSIRTPSPSEGEGAGGEVVAQWLPDPRSRVLESIREALKNGERVLVLVPWLARARYYQTQIEGSAILHSDLADGAAFRAWADFYSGTARCLIATRLGAWLAPLADRIILDEPENDDHKQDELAPRYDSRKISIWSAQKAKAALEAYGTTPPLHRDDPAPEISVPLTIAIRHPQGRSMIPMVQGDTLLALEEHEGPRIIIHPIRGSVARFVCRDCGWRAPCPRCGYGLSQEKDAAICRQCGQKGPMIFKCAKCGGTDLGKSLPGIERLKLAWKKHLPEVEVEWRGLSNEEMDAAIPERAFVAMTDGSLLGGGTEDVRRRERLCIAFRKLAGRVATSRGSLLIQSDEAGAEQWTKWLTAEGVAEFKTKERQERALFRYPPSVRLVKAIVTGDESKAYDWLERAEKIIQPKPQIRGPFPVAFRPTTKTKRWIIHLLFDPRIEERVLIQQLTPFASSAIIDLDPIAFLK